MEGTKSLDNVSLIAIDEVFIDDDVTVIVEFSYCVDNIIWLASEELFAFCVVSTYTENKSTKYTIMYYLSLAIIRIIYVCWHCHRRKNIVIIKDKLKITRVGWSIRKNNVWELRRCYQFYFKRIILSNCRKDLLTMGSNVDIVDAIVGLVYIVVEDTCERRIFRNDSLEIVFIYVWK